MFQRLHRSLSSPINSILINGGSRRPTSFGTRNGVAISTVITSRKCYPRGIAALDTVTVVGGEGTMTDVEYSLDGGAWTSNAGVWGTSKYIRVRGTSSADYETTLSANIEIGGYNYLFYVTTGERPGFGPTWEEPGTWNDALYWNETRESTEFLVTVDSDALLINNSPVYIG